MQGRRGCSQKWSQCRVAVLRDWTRASREQGWLGRVATEGMRTGGTAWQRAEGKAAAGAGEVEERGARPCMAEPPVLAVAVRSADDGGTSEVHPQTKLAWKVPCRSPKRWPRHQNEVASG